MTERLNRHHLFIVSLIVLAGLAGIIGTLNGINPSMDSVWYYTFARSIQAGQGFSAPISTWQTESTRVFITQWPPAYPALLAAGWDIPAWARVINIVCLIMSTGLTYALAIRLGLSKLASWAVTIAYLTLPAVVGSVFAVAHSEAPFVVLGLLILHLLLNYQRGQDVALWQTLTLMVLIALATLTRYVGVALGVLAVMVVAWWAWRGQPRRWIHVFMLPDAFIPLGLYMLYLYDQTGSFTGTQTTGDSLTLNDIPDSLRTILAELVHGIGWPLRQIGQESNVWPLLIAAIIGAVMLGLLWNRRDQWRDKLAHPHIVTALYIAVNLAVFWVLALRSQPVAGDAVRHYVVIFPAILALIGVGLAWANIGRGLVIGLVILGVISGGQALIETSDGILYNTPSFRGRIIPTLTDFMDEMPPATLIHTMDVGLVSQLLGDAQAVRMFSIEAIDEGYTCTDLIYPPEFDHALFLSIDNTFSRIAPDETLTNRLIDWAEPCGQVLDVRYEQPVLGVLVRLLR